MPDNEHPIAGITGSEQHLALGDGSEIENGGEPDAFLFIQKLEKGNLTEKSGIADHRARITLLGQDQGVIKRLRALEFLEASALDRDLEVLLVWNDQAAPGDPKAKPAAKPVAKPAAGTTAPPAGVKLADVH